MLTNLWTDKSLVNGSVGTAEGTAWDWSHGGSHHRRPPAVLLARFDSYTGPAYYKDDTDRATVVPILRRESQYMLRGVFCTRTRFPATVTYAITVHKSQDGVMFDAPFDHQSMRGTIMPERDPRELDALWRREHYLPTEVDGAD
ncbi:hypothetical protein E4U26_005697 [Claviceps purpurea]|nr:hypothetical protein E4U26_005697 [Claviceps purpurea]